MPSTNHSLLLEAAVVSEDEQSYHTLAQNLLSDHPICTQLPACVSDRLGTIAIIMLSTNHSLLLEAAVVCEDERYYHTLAQNLSNHPICTQLPASASDGAQ